MTKTENLIFDASVSVSKTRDIFASMQKRISMTAWSMLIPAIMLYLCFFTNHTLGVDAQKAIVASSSVFIVCCSIWIYLLTKTISELSSVMFFMNKGIESFQAKKREKEKSRERKALKKKKKAEELAKKTEDLNSVNLEKEQQK